MNDEQLKDAQPVRAAVAPGSQPPEECAGDHPDEEVLDDGPPHGSIVKVTVFLPRYDIEEIKRRARDCGISPTQFLRNAVVTESFLRDERAAGSTILIMRRQEDVVSEVIFR